MNPRLEAHLTAVQKVITGDKVPSNGAPIAPYRPGPQLVEFFNEFGFNDSYSWGGGFSTSERLLMSASASSMAEPES
ncbi:MAG: hypothetical protein IPK72_20955 [Candidatus Eisenbacteria bacterium]|nr:hypothetical protein [Candidatus Eisenbacteria bacterium]